VTLTPRMTEPNLILAGDVIVAYRHQWARLHPLGACDREPPGQESRLW
jgi:hypothetical protein